MSRLPSTARVGLTLLGALAAAALLGAIAPLPDPHLVHLPERLVPPCFRHPFGTDALGRDLLSRTLLGLWTSLRIALLAAAVAVLLGVGVGALAGARGGWIDAWLMRTVDVLYAVPFVCVVLYLVAVLRDWEPALRQFGIRRTTIVFAAVGATTWLTMARMVRSEVRRLLRRPFSEAARALGVPPGRILLRHVLPNAAGTVLVALTLTIPQILLYEAFLSFLGLGVEAPAVSLGRLAAEGAEALTPLRSPWWLEVFPGGMLALLLLATSLLGDGLRDRLAEPPDAFGEVAT